MAETTPDNEPFVSPEEMALQAKRKVEELNVLFTKLARAQVEVQVGSIGVEDLYFGDRRRVTRRRLTLDLLRPL